MSGRYAEAVIDGLLRMTRDLGKHPEEMTLPPRVYLNVAADLDAARAYLAGAYDPKIPVRVAYDYLAAFSFAPDDKSNQAKSLSRQVRIGDSFVIQGPRGSVTIREGK